MIKERFKGKKKLRPLKGILTFPTDSFYEFKNINS